MRYAWVCCFALMGCGGNVVSNEHDMAATLPIDAAMAHGDAALPSIDAGDSIDAGASTLAMTPPMGWNSWNKFGCNVSETLIEGIADALVTSGMRDAGYVYVNIDDCWQTSRDSNGVIVPDPTRFPDGIKGVADYVHGKGMKLGVYSDRGTMTCGGRPGSQGYETIDAKTYASWGVDYLKYDNCNAQLDEETQYQTMQAALANSGRDIVFSLCAWAFQSWMPQTGQLWRTTADISDTWASMTNNLDQNSLSAGYATPGHWNDPDDLEVGNGGMTATEYRAHFSLWAMMAAPLIAGNDVQTMTQETHDILVAPEVIAVDQDPLGLQGGPILTSGDTQVWAKTLSGAGVRAVALFNRGAAAADITVHFTDLGLAASSATVRDLWARSDLGAMSDHYTVNVPSHGVVLVKVVGTEIVATPGTWYLSDLPWYRALNGYGPMEHDMSNGNMAAGDGATLSLRGQTYKKGIGTNSIAEVTLRIGGTCSKLEVQLGVDDDVTGQGSVVFQVWADGTKTYESATLTGKSAAVPLSLDITKVRSLRLVVNDAGDGNQYHHGDWADAKVVCP